MNKVTKKQAEEFARQFFGIKRVQQDADWYDYFVFKCGVVALNVYKFYGEGSDAPYPYAGITINTTNRKAVGGVFLKDGEILFESITSEATEQMKKLAKAMLEAVDEGSLCIIDVCVLEKAIVLAKEAIKF